MKRGVFLLILTAGVLSLLFGIIMPVMYFSYRDRLRQAESDLALAEMQLQNANANANLAGPNPNIQGQDPQLLRPIVPIAQYRHYRMALGTAQELLSRDPYRAGVILGDKSQCPSELCDFGWHWAVSHLPRIDRILFHDNCHAAVLSNDGRTLAVQTGEARTKNRRIVVVDLGPDKRPDFTLADPSVDFTLAPDGSRLAVLRNGKVRNKIALYSLTDRSLPPVEIAGEAVEMGFTADGSMLVGVTNGANANLTRWRVDTGKEVNRFAVQGDRMWLTADRSELVSVTFAGDEPGKVTRYDVATGMIRHTTPIALVNQETGKTPYSLSRDGTSLATVRADGGQQRLETWDLQKGKLRWTVVLPEHGLDNLVLQMAFSPDGKTLASAGCAEEVYLWDAATGACHKWFHNGPSGRPEFLLWQPDGMALVVDTMLGPTRWRSGIPADRLVWTTPHATDGLWAISADGRFLAATTSDGALKLWDVAGRRAIATIGAADSKVSQLVFSAEGGELAVVRANHDISLVDTATGKVHAAVPAHEKGLAALAFTPRATSLTTLDKDGIVRRWDCANGQQLMVGGIYPGAVLSPDGLRVAYLEDAGKTVIVTDVRTQKEIARFEEDHLFARLGFFGGSDDVIAFYDSGCFSTWNLVTKTRLLDASSQSLPPPPPRPVLAPILDVDLVQHWSVSGAGDTIATLTDLGQVRVYDGGSGNLRFTTRTLALMKPGPLQLQGPRPDDAPSGNQIDRFELSRDGRFLLIVGREMPQNQPFCQILDGLTGDEVRPVPLPAGPLQDAMFSADGSTFAVARPKGPITLWRIP